MAVTREKHTAIFLHVIDLIGEPADGSGSITTMLRANNINNIYDICDLSRDHIATLSCIVSDKKIKLTRGHQNLLKMIGNYQTSRRKTDRTFKELSWLSVDQEMFDEFRMDYDPNEYLRDAPLTVPSVPIQGTTSTVNHLRDFKRGNKRDPTLFPVLKDTKQWDAWYV